MITLLLSMAIFFFIAQVGAYSVFEMYRVNRSAQLHMGVTLAMIGLLMAGVHVLAPYETLRSEEHTSELQSRFDLVCRLLLEKKKKPMIKSIGFTREQVGAVEAEATINRHKIPYDIRAAPFLMDEYVGIHCV